jgi:hypothetical protein
MKVGDSVRKAILDWEQGDLESAMLHACNAVDGTAKKVYGQQIGNKDRFTRVLRENYGILGPMGMPNINVVDQRFPITIHKPTAPGGQPDLADVIYAIHRCHHGHGDELPDGFELIPDLAGVPGLTRITVDLEHGKLQLSDRIIFGLIAVAVLSPVNRDQKVPDGFHLTYGPPPQTIGNQRMVGTRC